MGEIDILIKDPSYPCAPYRRTGHRFYVDIMHCDGSFLEWKGITYNNYPLAQRIHDQVKVPAGCYVVRAAALCGNVTTQTAVVQVCCNEKVCVNLLATSPRFCFVTAMLALHPEIIREVPRDVLDNADDALGKVIEHLPKVPIEPPADLVKELLKREKQEKEKDPREETELK